MKTLALLVIAVLLAGCHSAPQQSRWTPPQFDAPKDGQIQVALYGEIKSPGLHWVPASATLASIETVAGLATPAPRHVMITRMDKARPNNTVYVIPKMGQTEKEAVSLKHGDIVQFYTGQPPQVPQ